jgi:hypothetical protein
MHQTERERPHIAKDITLEVKSFDSLYPDTVKETREHLQSKYQKRSVTTRLDSIEKRLQELELRVAKAEHSHNIFGHVL